MADQRPFGATAGVTDQGFSTVRLRPGCRILIVDDEELMRDIVAVLLEEQGAQVLLAANGDEGIAQFREHHTAIDCVFLDYSMPGKSGYDVYRELEKISANPPVLFVSGLKFPPEVEELWRSGRIATLTKPFHEVELVKAINSIVASRR